MSKAKLLQVSPEQKIYSRRFSLESVHLSAWKGIRAEDMFKLIQTGQRFLSERPYSPPRSLSLTLSSYVTSTRPRGASLFHAARLDHFLHQALKYPGVRVTVPLHHEQCWATSFQSGNQGSHQSPIVYFHLSVFKHRAIPCSIKTLTPVFTDWSPEVTSVFT